MQSALLGQGCPIRVDVANDARRALPSLIPSRTPGIMAAIERIDAITITRPEVVNSNA